jgi:capsular polysaccharide biosynthesis protein
MDRERRFLAMPSEKNHFSSDIYRANKNIRALRPISITEDAVALNTSYTDNFYHWFVDLVGRMLLLPDWDDKVICADTRYPYQKETLALLGVAPERIFSLDDYTLYRFKTLSVVSYPRSCPDPHSYAALKEMARRVKPDARERSLPKRVYISRGDVSGRRSIVNEQELLPIFKKYGFRRMIFSNLSLEDQIRAARNADHLIFPHGAAGVNLVFSPPGIRFMEIMSPRALDASSVCVCQSLGVPYHLLLGEMPAGDSMQAPFSVEPQALLRALERLVA